MSIVAAVSRTMKCLVLTLALIVPAFAQQDRPPRLDRAFVERIDAESVTDEPYTRWKTHRGKPEECLALVRVHKPEGLQTFNALVVRCDGFLMVPQAAWDAVKARVPVDVIVTQAEGEASKGPFPIMARNSLKPRTNDYHFIKVNRHHLRCLPVLASWNVVEGTPVRLVWTTLAADGQTLVMNSVGATCQAPPKDRALSYCDLTFAPGAQPTQVPDGTLVVDATSQAAVGMISRGAQPTRFMTTRHFGDFCAEVALAPNRDAAQGKSPKERVPPLIGEMVRVPGKPTVYLNKEFVGNYNTSIVCTPDFYCDKYLATIGEWQQFLDTRRDRPLPDGWDTRNNRNHPLKYPKLPILGAIAGDMQDYAAWRDKRLLTSVEWILAAETSSLGWLQKLENEEATVTAELEQAQVEYYAAVSQRLQDLERNRPKITGQLREEGAPLEAPIMDLMLEYRTRINQIREHYSRFVARFPGQPHEVGSRSEDHSDWGVYDVNMNAPEACLGWAKNYGFTVKPRPAGQDPFISILKIIRVRASINKTPTAVGAVHGTIAGTEIDDPMVWAAMWRSQFGGMYRHQPPGGSYYIELNSRALLAFRCAW